MSEIVLSGVPLFTCGHEHFLATKFSGLKDVDFSYSFQGDQIIIKYFTEIYFSGNNMKMKVSKIIPGCEKSSFPFNLFSKITPACSFIIRTRPFESNNFWKEFNKANYKPSEKIDFIPDYVQWFAENTGTMDILNELRESMRDVLKFCDKYIKGDNVK